MLSCKITPDSRRIFRNSHLKPQRRLRIRPTGGHGSGIGIAPGANINYQTGHAIFEATHGTAPNIAGKDVVNPCSIILSAVMMLEYFDWKEAAALIEKALEQSFLDARATHDLARFMPNGTSLSTSAFTREIVERIEKQK